MQGIPKGAGKLRSLRFDVYGNEFATDFFIKDTTDEYAQAHTAKKMAKAFSGCGQEEDGGNGFLNEVTFRVVAGDAETETVFKTTGV